MSLSFRCPDNACSATGDFPYLRTRLGPLLYNLIPLPQTTEDSEAIPFGVKCLWLIRSDPAFLQHLARLQAYWNKLPTCLVLGPHRCIEFTPDGDEVFSNQVVRDRYEVTNHLAPWAPLERTGWWKQRNQSLWFGSAPERTALLISLNKGGRAATPEERERFSGRNHDGIPRGLARCLECSEWKGQCLDPDPKYHGVLVSVSCRCENTNRCARCFLPLYGRKVNANYYNKSDGHVWYVPGSICERHRCGMPSIPR